jgi:hypothetical protein
MFEEVNPSLNVRDYFAGRAFQALLAKAGESPDFTAVARQAVECADALIHALESGENPYAPPEHNG